MCSTILRCSICNETTTNQRIIVELCGHQKCRACFIREENGCTICIATNAALHMQSMAVQPEDLSVNSSIGIDQDKRVEVIENVLIMGRAEPESFTEPMQKPQRKLLPKPKPEQEEKEKASDERRRKRSSLVIPHVTTKRDADDQVTGYKCEICEKNFRSRSHRKYHLFCDETQSRPFTCDVCGGKFVLQSHLDYHKRTHQEKIFRCTVCNRTFINKCGLKRHVSRHTAERQYECGTCHERFRLKEQLNVHENQHKNIAYKCTQCPKRFNYKSNLNRHILAHAGKIREECNVCHKVFCAKSALNTHMLTHTNERPFGCTNCAKTFIDKRSLTRHIKSHLKDAVCYECTLCPVKSSRRDNILRHVRSMHTNVQTEIESIVNGICETYDKRKQTENNKLKPTECVDDAPVKMATILITTPMDPMKQTKLAVPMGKTELTKPTKPIDPMESVDLTESVGLTESEKPTDPVEQTDPPEPIKQSEPSYVPCVSNTSSSVIKFVGKSTAPDTSVVPTQPPRSHSIPVSYESTQDRCVEVRHTMSVPVDPVPAAMPHTIPTLMRNNSAMDRRNDRRKQASTEVDTTSEWITLDTSDMPTYQPLTLDPLPQMEPLPLLTTQNSSNMSVYRQLLSPYFRRSH